MRECWPVVAAERIMELLRIIVSVGRVDPFSLSRFLLLMLSRAFESALRMQQLDAPELRA